MHKIMKEKTSNHFRITFQWFFRYFLIFSILFCIILVPFLFYLKNVFSTLQLKQIQQQSNLGAEQLESTVTGLFNVAEVLTQDPRFISLRYEDETYTSVPANICNQMKTTLHGLLFPIENISDAALQFSQNIAFTSTTLFFEGSSCYYPDYFCVDDLSYEEWMQLLAKNRTGFMPVHHIKTYTEEYDALIFATRWVNNAYLYACLDVKDIKSSFITEAEKEGWYITLFKTDGTILYSDLPDTETHYQTISTHISAGDLYIDIHVADYIFAEMMQPLWYFLIMYCSICVVILILLTLGSTYMSSKPIIKLLHTFENIKNIPSAAPDLSAVPEPRFNFRGSLDYISNSILSADKHLEQYRNTIQTQQKILQARFLEKAINGQLTSPEDINLFLRYFPNFPAGYSMMLIRLQIRSKEGDSLYPEPLLLLQSFLQAELPEAYLQQFNNSDLLLLIAEKDFDNYRSIIDFVISNINQEEPSYNSICVASRIYYHPENLPVAYRQLRDLIALPSCGKNKVYTAEDYSGASITGFSMPELLTLYTAITHGNRNMAMNMLLTYSQNADTSGNSGLDKSVYEMILMLLNCIKLEYPTLLIDEYIPLYNANSSLFSDRRLQTGDSLFTELSDVISRFCSRIGETLQPEPDSFANQLLQYIDLHYTEYDLCLTTLETHFKCSSSTLRKAFKKVTDITITEYIEKKRLKLATELLSKNQDTIGEIVTKCGYTSYNSFYKAYKRVYGTAPTVCSTNENLH